MEMVFCTAARIYYLDLIKGLKISFDLFFLIIFFQFIYAIELNFKEPSTTLGP